MRLTKSCLRRLIKEELLSLHEEVKPLSAEANEFLAGLNFETLGHRQNQAGAGLKRHWVNLIKGHGLEAAQKLYKKLSADAESITTTVPKYPQLKAWLIDLNAIGPDGERDEKTVTVGFVLDMFYDDEFGYKPEWARTDANQWSDGMEGLLSRMFFVE